jgi:hypothetical protein
MVRQDLPLQLSRILPVLTSLLLGLDRLLELRVFEFLLLIFDFCQVHRLEPETVVGNVKVRKLGGKP